MDLFDQYEDYIEPSEADKIISEARENLLAILNDSAKEIMDEVKSSEQKLEDLKLEIRKKELELSVAEKKLHDLEKEVNNEKSVMPEKYVARFIHEKIGPFAPGDICYRIKKIRKKVVTCPMCHGEKKVHADVSGTEVEIACPNCHGLGFNVKNEYEILKQRVEHINVEMCFSSISWQMEKWSAVNLTLDDGYTCLKEELYTTKEDAEADVKKMMS